MNKNQARIRRAKRSRFKIRECEATRLCVYKTPRHIYAQIISPAGDKVLASASTVDKEIKNQVDYSGNVNAAKIVGKTIAERAISAGIQTVAFDRSGFIYHGRVKALADAAREGGLQF